MLVLGIDPGLATGWALIGDEDGLIEAGLGDPRKEFFFGASDSENIVTIECPVVYPHSKTNPNDLIKLAVMVGEYKQYFCHARVKLVAPATWKGQVPKTVTEKRVRAQFPNAGEFLDKYPRSTLHNVSDAIGLAAWGLAHDR